MNMSNKLIILQQLFSIVKCLFADSTGTTNPFQRFSSLTGLLFASIPVSACNFSVFILSWCNPRALHVPSVMQAERPGNIRICTSHVPQYKNAR